MLPTLRFSLEFGLVFCGVAVLFEDLRVACFMGFQIEIACLFFADFSFADCIFSYFMALLRFQFTASVYWACFYENLLILGLFFRICLPTCSFDFLADFSFC